MGSLAAAWALLIPATILSSHYAGLSVEYGLTIIWGSFALIVVTGLASTYARSERRHLHHTIRPAAMPSRGSHAYQTIRR
jgi:hypothetical protein